MHDPLKIATDRRDESTTVYTLRGSLHGSPEGYAFQELVRQRVAAGAARVIVDLSGVGRIDSSGIGILVAIMWSASKGGGKLVLAALPRNVEKVLGIAMLLDHIDHAESVEAAVAKLG